MKNVTIFGKGNMGSAIGKIFTDGKNSVEFLDSKTTVSKLGDIVVLAIPYGAVEGVLKTYKKELAGKVVIDITNPVDFGSLDGLVVASDTSAAALIQKELSDSFVVKAFNTNFAATLASKDVAGKVASTVMLASDYNEAKAVVKEALSGSGLEVVDAGSLKRARELEAMGFLQITLAIRNEIGWTAGFAVLK